MENTKQNQPVPKRRANIQSAHIKTKHGSDYYVLHNPNANTYLRIDAENYQIWQLMDGKRNLTDIIFEYHKIFGTFPLDRLNNLLKKLAQNSLILTGKSKPVVTKKTGFNYRLAKLANDAFQKEYAFKNADRLLDIIYCYIGKYLFKRPLLIFFGLISIIGFALFIYWEPNPIFQFLDLRGDYDLGLVVIFLSYPLLILIHELAHGLACKHYRRKVRKAGIMFYFGVPAFFVDSTDMWLEERPFARAGVAFAGPAINIIFGGFLCVIVAIIPWNDFSLALYQTAYLSFFMALLNLNPLLEYDGYYILMEWLEVPNLRKESLSFLYKKITGTNKKEQHYSRKAKIYYIYGFLSILFTALMITAVLYIWKNELAKMVLKLFSGKEVVAALLLGGLTLIAGGFLAVGLTARIILLAGRLTSRNT